MLQTHQTLNDVLDVRITSVGFFQTDLIRALDNCLCLMEPTPGYPTQRRCRRAEIPPLTLSPSSPSHTSVRLRHQLLYILSFFSGRLMYISGAPLSVIAISALPTYVSLKSSMDL